MENEGKIEIQKFFSKIHGILAIAMLCYISVICIFGLTQYTTVLYILTIVTMLFGIDYIISLTKLRLKFRIIGTIRALELFISALLMIVAQNKAYIPQLGGIFYIVIVFESAYLIQSIFPQQKSTLVMLMEIPLALITIYYLFISEELVSHKVVLIAFIILCQIITSGVVQYTYIVMQKSNDEIERLTRKKEIVEKNNVVLLKSISNLNAMIVSMRSQQLNLEVKNQSIKYTNTQTIIQNMIQRYISSSLEIKSLLDLIGESLSEALSITCCGIIVYGEQGREIHSSFYSIQGQEHTHIFREDVQSNLFQEEFRELKKPFVDNFVEKGKYEFLSNPEVGSILVFPLFKGNIRRGLLVVEKEKHGFFIDSLEFFNNLAAQLIVALDNAQLYEQMQEMAIQDGLTGIYNRTHLNEVLEKYIAHSKKNKESLAVILFDIDLFKTINDSYGHVFGDLVIKTCASIADKIAKEHDGIAARYGGEEFVILLRNKSMYQLEDIAKELHENVNNAEVMNNGEKVNFNISSGITSYPSTCPDPKELLIRADWAMYYSKKHGRGRTTFDSEAVRLKMKESYENSEE